ncbi:HesB/YadR/YfhF family protein [Pseudalkalibacillus caeni]|uniref:Core domain-containing protein n=1 Tax=Exobacillus caeni TaxID=2574798 RepID=A0A5R9FCQ3_9BACL|nr:iron-sulfur cluster biosynthesis family protein [Pseudalkalibacillus caeni]TLS37425.1 hypothetical protein FCL54_09760 [Pseudalkalibacillus caeni]
MTFSVTDSAARFYKHEMDLKNGDCLRLFCRYAGSGAEGGFKLGVMADHPEDGDFIQQFNGINYFVRPGDQWFIDQMKLDYDESNQDVICELPSMV